MYDALQWAGPENLWSSTPPHDGERSSISAITTFAALDRPLEDRSRMPCAVNGPPRLGPDGGASPTYRLVCAGGRGRRSRHSASYAAPASLSGEGIRAWVGLVVLRRQHRFAAMHPKRFIFGEGQVDGAVTGIFAALARKVAGRRF